MINRQAMMPQYTFDLDAIWLGGQEMATAEQLLEHPEERLDHPHGTQPAVFRAVVAVAFKHGNKIASCWARGHIRQVENVPSLGGEAEAVSA
jgi:hypothetical protein